MNRTLRVLALEMIVPFVVLVALASPVLADPIGFSPPYNNAPSVIAGITAINLPADLFLFALLLYVVYRRFGTESGLIRQKTLTFIGSIVLGGLIIAVFGAIIDFAFFFRSYPPAYGPGYYFFLNINAPLWSSDSPTLAAILILVSIYFVSVVVVRLGFVLSLIPSCAISCVNLYSWIVMGSWIQVDDQEVQPAVQAARAIYLGLVLVPCAFLVLALLWRWHRSHHFENDVETPDDAQMAIGSETVETVERK